MRRCSIEAWRSVDGTRNGLCVRCGHPWEDHERGRCIGCEADAARRKAEAAK